MKIVKLGKQDYQTVFDAMKHFTENRKFDDEDELWQVEHFPVFTQGKAGKPEHILHSGDIPIVQTDRGGQVTYHGPGQIVIYTLVDFARRKISVRELVNRIERAIIATLADYQIMAHNDPARPGVYVDNRKIASLGLRISKNSVYHGLALNWNMDLEPFLRINPCGYANLQMTQIADLIQIVPDYDEVCTRLLGYLKEML